MPDIAIAPATTPTDAPAVPAAPAQEAPKLIAGKYKDQSAFEKGIREGVTKAGFDDLPEGDLIGEGKRFKDVAAAEKYYAGVQKLIGGGKPAAPAAEPKPSGELRIGGDPLPEDADVPTILTKAGLKADELAARFTEKGDLDESDYAAIRKVRPGLSKSDIKFIAQGIHAQAALKQIAMTKVMSEADAVFGGEAGAFKAFLDSEAAQIIPAEKHATYNKLINDPATCVDAARLLKTMLDEHNGASGSRPLVNGTTKGGQGGAKSLKEFQDAARRADSGDPAARAIVDATPLDRIQGWGGM